MRLVPVVLLAWLALLGCTPETLSPESATTPSATSTGVPPPTRSASDEPTGYRYVLQSYCGYPALGTLTVVEHRGLVREVARVGEPSDYVPEPAVVPSLADMLARAEAAPPSAEVKVVRDDNGLPVSIRIDDPRGQDSDECYEVSDLVPLR